VPSIASVSRFRMVTREAEDVSGTEIRGRWGKVRDVREAGCAPGTVIEARPLFFNMPARRKFLRAESTESAHVEHQLRLHALAAPWVRFRLRRDDREVFDLPPCRESPGPRAAVAGAGTGRELIALPLTHGNGVSVEGFVLPASHARKGRRHQFVFLNGRPVEDAVISRALAEGFRGALADGLHPAAWLWVDLEPALVDVNVHPAKREVRFHRPVDLRDAILDGGGRWACGRPLRCHPPQPAPPASVPASVPAVMPVFQPPQPLLENWVGNSVTSPRESALPVTIAQGGGAPDFRILGMLHQRFVVLESDDGLVLFDPKAARERIFYETLLRQREGGPAAQGLLVPVLLEMDPRDTDLLLRERSALADAGIEVESFGGNTVQVRTLPACLGVDDPRPFIGGLLDEMLHDSASGARFAFERLARLLARRAAALVVPRLVEAKPLLDELFTCDLPYCAADGRPTLTEFGMRELERRFGLGK
jgi:DNA mismatch repair protein MutL